MSAVTAGVAALSAAAVTGGYAADAAPAGPQAASAAQGGSPSHSAAIPGAQLWVKRYNGPANGPDQALSAAVSPDGVRVFVTGFSHGAGSKADYATIAYRAGTGTRLWASRYNGPGNGTDLASSVAVSPDGDRVFVTGFSHGTKSGPDYATIAYRADTGTRLWVQRYNGPGNGTDRAMSVTASPAGNRVFVTGQSTGSGSGLDYATIAYRAGTGTRLWVQRYNGPGNGPDGAMSVAASHAGDRVFVTGHSTGAGSGLDYATIAYRAATGTRLWTERYSGPGKNGDGARSVAVSPGGRTVFVTGTSFGRGTGDDYATVAYRAATGARQWVSRYNGPRNTFDVANSLAVDPASGKVYVTGVVGAFTEKGDFATVAYRPATGTRRWVRFYNDPVGTNVAQFVAVNPVSGAVVVTGNSFGRTSSWDYATVAYGR